MDHAGRRVQAILDAYGEGHVMTWDDVVRVAIIRLHDLADLSRRKAAELRKPQLLDDAKAYDRDGHYLATLRGQSWRPVPARHRVTTSPTQVVHSGRDGSVAGVGAMLRPWTRLAATPLVTAPLVSAGRLGSAGWATFATWSGKR
jgi:hypothetical protein